MRGYAGREARKLFNFFDLFCTRPRGKRRRHREPEHTHDPPPTQVQDCQHLHVQKDLDTASEISDIPEGIPIAAERQTREHARTNNAPFYTTDLRTDDQIRLLRIEPGAGPLQGSLEYASLSHAPDYDALSYCWGHQADLNSINIDGQDGFKVSKHLYHALLRLRRQKKSRLVWVDVVCVNQANIPERNRSVNLMWHIYRKAQRVIIWIGETEPAHETCKRLYPGHEGDTSSLTLCAKLGLPAFEHGNLFSVLTEKLKDMEMESNTRRAAGEVWWKRLWVVQEFSCSQELPTVYLGPHAIGWDFFAEIMRTDAHDRLHLFHELRKKKNQSLFDLLLMAKIFHCSEPRDRIYALLGLAKKTDMRIVPDYSKPAAQVFEEATHYLIREEQSLDVLLDERMSRTDTNFPSWIPNFESLRERRLVQTQDEFAAGKGVPEVRLINYGRGSISVPSLTATPTTSALQMRGIYFDRIVSRTSERDLLAPDFAHHPITNVHFHQPSLSAPLQTVGHILRHLGIKYTDAPLHGLDRIPRVGYLMLEYLLGGTHSAADHVTRINAEKDSSPKLQDLRRRIDRVLREASIPSSPAIQDDLRVSAVCESVFLWCRHKRSGRPPDDETRRLLGGQELYSFRENTHKRDFFATANGFIGLGPASLEVGDHIVVPFGASRPFVLREKEGHYVLVGDAVLPGVMSGQLVNLYKEGGVEATEFLLR